MCDQQISWVGFFCIVVGVMLAVATAAWAEVPNKISYQGRLVDSVTGEPLTGTHDMTFWIYDVAEGGNLL